MVSEHWRNCDTLASDAEIAKIDALEERLRTEERSKALKIRGLITSFEVCHHNSLRWAERIVQAIADGAIPPTSGRKRTEHPVSIAHLNLRELLTRIVGGTVNSRNHGEIQAVDVDNVQERFGNLSEQKRWLIKLVLDNLEYHLFDAKLIPTMRTADNRMFAGGDLNVESDEDAMAYFSDEFEYYKNYRDVTILMVDDLHPSEKEHRMPFLLVIQFANPCSVNYFQYVASILEMIRGADAVGRPGLPFPFCGHYTKKQYAEFSKYIRACRSFLNLNGDTSDKGMFGRPDEDDLSKRWLGNRAK